MSWCFNNHIYSVKNETYKKEKQFKRKKKKMNENWKSIEIFP